MRRFLILALGIVLAGCGMQTRYTVEVLGHTFVAESDKSGDFGAGSLDLYLPDADGDVTTPDGGFLAQAPSAVVEHLYAAQAVLAVDLTNTGSTDLTAALDFYLAPASETGNIYQPPYRVDGATLVVPPGEAGRLVLDLRLAKDAHRTAYQRLKDSGGAFRIGFHLRLSGDGGRYQIDTASLALTSERLGQILGP